MSTSPVITFKAGKCEADFSTSPPRIKPVATPGYLYLYHEDDLVHFCWRERAASLSNPDLDLFMVPMDASFQPYLGPEKIPNKSPVNGRVFVLKFSSSSQRHFFWLQSRENPRGEPSTFSPRDLRLGEIVNSLLQGNDMDPAADISNILENGGSGGAEDDDDDTMEDVQPSSGDRRGSGGAGPGATGGDFREEGEESREGGSDGGRADQSVTDQTNEAVRNFLSSLAGGAGISRGQQQADKPFTTLAELLPSSITIPMIQSAGTSFVDELLIKHLPSSLTFLEHQVDDPPETQDDIEIVTSSVEALDQDQKLNVISKVLRSPQFFQGLISLTGALRDGGLPTVSEALKIEVEHGGYTDSSRSVPLSGGRAVEAFIEGIRKSVEKSQQ